MSGSEELVQCHDGTDHQQASRKRQVGRDEHGETRQAFPLRRVVQWGVGLSVGSLLAFSVSPATAKPCAAHQGAAKKACVKQVRRDAMDWPPNPTWSEIVKRAQPGELAALRSIAECEQPGSGAFPYPAKYGPKGWRTAWGINAGATYVGAFGMYRGTYGIGASGTGYPAPPSASPAQETGVAMVVARRFGYSAWGCW